MNIIKQKSNRRRTLFLTIMILITLTITSTISTPIYVAEDPPPETKLEAFGIWI